MNNIPFDSFLKEQLQDPEFAAEYLNSALEDGTPKDIAAAMADILKARDESPSKATLEPAARQLQEFFRRAHLRLSAQVV